MAGAPFDPIQEYEMPDPYAVPELTFQEEVDRETRKTLREVEAYTLLDNDFDVPLPEDYTPPAVEKDENYVPPQTFEDARKRVLATKAQLEAYRKQIEDYAEETRGLLPMDDRSTGEIIERANIIARARRDILGNMEQIEEAEKQLAEAELAGNEDPGFWQKALGVAMDALGIVEPVLNVLAAPQLNLAGFISQVPEAFGKVPDVAPDGTLIPESDQAWVDVPWWQRIPPAGLVAGLIDPDAPIMQRGRQFNRSMARKMSALEDSIMTTPVLGHVYGYATPTGLGPKIAEAITGFHEDDVRDFRNQLAFEITSDPLLLLEVGPLTKVGKLRELSRVGAGVLDKAAFKKTLDELPELSRALGSADEAFDAASRGDIVTRLRIRGASADEAAELAKRFDTERARNLTNLRQLTSNDPAEFAKIGREALDPAQATTKAQRLAHARQVDYLDRIHEFGRATDKNFVDPIIGRSWYEQAMIGQRLAAMQPIIQRFGDKPWLQNTIRYGSRPWMAITGTSLKHDISDKAELLELYYMQQLRRMDMGAEFHRYEADVAKRAANVLNGMNEQQALQVQEAAIPLVEKIKRGERMVAAGKAFPDDDGLANAAYQYAKWYEFDAGTARAIENRFNFRVAELSGDLGYFGREFSDELQAKIFNNKKARDWLWGEKARRGLDSISTAWLGYEKQRKYKDLDFFESERELRDGLRRAGLNIADDEILWKRDGFDILSKRLKKSQSIAERRGLVYGWVDAAGKADPVLLDTAKGILDEMGAVRVARAAENVAEAGVKVDAATDARAGFEAGRGAVRKAATVAERQADEAVAAGQRAEEVRTVAAESVEGGQVAYRQGRDAEQKAVQVAEELKAEAVENLKATPGAVEAREGLKQARKILASATRHEQLAEAAELMARTMGATLPPGAGHDAVRAAEALVRYAENVIKADPAIRDADQALRAANQMLADAREVAARVETFELQRQVDDLLKQADAAVGMKGIGAKYLTQAMRAELRKAKKLVDEVAGAYKARQSAQQAAAAGDMESAKQFRRMVREARHKSVRDVRAALSTMRSELRKDAPAALLRTFDRIERQALKLEELTTTAQKAVAKPVAAAVRKQESAALKNLEKAQERMANADVAAMSPEAKAQWVQSTLTQQGVRPAPGNVSALEVMQKSKIPMPDDLDELARLHVTEFTPNQADEFRRLHDKLYWKDMQPEHILDNIAKVLIDYPKAVFQGTVLSRWASLSKDLIGNAVNLAMNPRTVPYFTKALRDAWKASRDGEFADDVAELQAIGVLRTSRQEVLEGGSEIAQLIPGQAGLAAERVGKMGPLAGSIKTLDKAVKRAAKAVGIKLKEGKQLAEGIAGYRDFKLQARQIFEEAGRIATYREALSRGYSKLEAVEEVYKWWGKFDELSKLEKTVLNRILFFWSWMVRSVPVALRHLIEHPVRSKLVLSLLAGDVMDDEKMPPWLRRMGGWVLGDDGNGKVRAMSTLGSSWFSPLFSALQGEAANRMMNGQPWEAAQGAFKDVVRSAPPHVQGAIEYVTEYDLFTQKPWWQDRNAKVGSNAKAPTALWWFYEGDVDDGASWDKKARGAIAKTLGLKATGRSGEPQYLTMDPRWSWFFGMMPGVETSLSDVSAFFRPTATSEIVPEIDIIKGSARIAGVPIYDVPMETGKRQINQFRSALLKEGDKMSGGALSAYNRRLVPGSMSTRGREIAAFKERQRKHGMKQLGMSGDQADRFALNQMAREYPDEFRLLDLQYRLERWEDHIMRVEDGHAEMTEQLTRRVELLQRRGQVDRLAKQELKRTLEMMAELGLKPPAKKPDRALIGLREAKDRRRKRISTLGGER